MNRYIVKNMAKALKLVMDIGSCGYHVKWSPSMPNAVVTDAPQSLVNSYYKVRSNPELSEMDAKKSVTYKSIFSTTNAKAYKSQELGYLNAVHYLAPANETGVTNKGVEINICPSASDACRKACLFTAGSPAYLQSKIAARINKTIFLFKDPQEYLYLLARGIDFIRKESGMKRMTPCIRLNGTSDLRWEKGMQIPRGDFISFRFKETNLNLFETFPDMQFYDYTKIFDRIKPNSEAMQYRNYDLTYSYSGGDNIQGGNESKCRQALAMGVNVAVVFDLGRAFTSYKKFEAKYGKKYEKYKKQFPLTYFGHPVVDGDVTDLRFTDPNPRQNLAGNRPSGMPVVVALAAKGDAFADDQGFVIKNWKEENK
jgi:hypothetical protein